MVTLIIEDGTSNPDANTYIDEAFATDYLEGKGIVVPAQTKLLPLIVQATDYMECITRYMGQKTVPDQALQFPRTGARVNGVLLEPTAVPTALKRAQAQLVADMVSTGRPLLSSKTEYVLKSRTLGPLKQEWAAGNQTVVGADPHPRFWSYINQFLNGGVSNGGVIR